MNVCVRWELDELCQISGRVPDCADQFHVIKSLTCHRLDKGLDLYLFILAGLILQLAP